MGKGALNKHMKSKDHSAMDDTRLRKSAGLMVSWSRTSNPPQGIDNFHGLTESGGVITQPKTSSTGSLQVLKLMKIL